MKTDMCKRIPFIIAMVGAFLMVMTFFMPYGAGTKEYKENLLEYADEVVYDETDITAKEIVNISMAEYIKLYSELGDMMGVSDSGAFYVGLIIVIAVFVLLTLLFASLRKPVATIISALLSVGLFHAQCWDYTDRGVIPSDSYNWGMGYYVFYAAVVVTIIGAGCLLAQKIINKKNKKKFKWMLRVFSIICLY